MNEEKKLPKIWHPQQEKILKAWGEAAACYRYMHYQAYCSFKNLSMKFTIPLIIVSTVTGTANFAQETFPPSVQPFVPSAIGGLNLITAIATTIMQFLKINELIKALEKLTKETIPFAQISQEAKINYEGLKTISFSKVISTNFETIDTVPAASITWHDSISNKEELQARMARWLKRRLNLDNLILKED